MGQRGPKPLPDNVHRMRGNPSKKPLNSVRYGDRIPIAEPYRPKNVIKGKALVVWKRMCEELTKIGVLSSVDESALVRYCITYVRLMAVEERLESIANENPDKPFTALITKTPSGYEQQSVLFQIRSKCHEELKSLEAVFGMTPSSRTSVDTQPQADLFDNQENGNGDGSDSPKGPARFIRPG